MPQPAIKLVCGVFLNACMCVCTCVCVHACVCVYADICDWVPCFPFLGQEMVPSDKMKTQEVQAAFLTFQHCLCVREHTHTHSFVNYKTKTDTCSTFIMVEMAYLQENHLANLTYC